MSIRKVLLTASAVSSLIGLFPHAAHASVCPGVELRVTLYSKSAFSSVSAHISAAFATFDAMIESEGERLLAAQTVLNTQESQSSSQENVTNIQAAKAAGSAYVAARVAKQVREAADEFGTTGYNACAVESSMTQFYSSYENTFSSDPSATIKPFVAGRPGSLARPTQWMQAVRSGNNTSAGALFNGDLNASAQYINLVMGPPDSWQRSNSLSEGRLFQAHKMTTDARKSAAMRVLSSIAKENAGTGPQRALDNVLSQYTGDGGERWSAAMASAHPRGVLLDAVRLEAANVAAEAYAVQKTMRTEFAIASYLLTRSDNIAHQKNQPLPPLPLPSPAGEGN